MTGARLAAILLGHVEKAAGAARRDIESELAREKSEDRRVPVMNSVQAARQLGISDRKVREACNAGRLPHQRLGTSYLISERSLLAWVESGKQSRTLPANPRGESTGEEKGGASARAG